jgi:hypothetical protein
MTGKPRVGKVYRPSAELSRTSSYSSSRFLQPLPGKTGCSGDAQRGTANAMTTFVSCERTEQLFSPGQGLDFL